MSSTNNKTSQENTFNNSENLNGNTGCNVEKAVDQENLDDAVEKLYPTLPTETEIENDADKDKDQETNTPNSLVKKDGVVNDVDVADEENKNANVTEPTETSESKNIKKDNKIQYITGFLSNWTSYESIKKNLSPKSPRQSLKIKENKNGTDSNEGSDVKISDLVDKRGPSETDMNRNYPMSEKNDDKKQTYAEFFKSWKMKDDVKEKEKIRNTINDAFLLNTAVELNEDNISSILNRGDFFIARRIWNKAEGKYHDHFVIVKERDEEGVDVIHISDISEKGQETIQETWKFDMLKENIRNEKISGVKLSFMDRQEEADSIIDRASSYKVSEEQKRALHYACFCVFGLKLPIFSAEQLALCDDNTLLLLRGAKKDTSGEYIVMLLHKVDNEGTLHISLDEDDKDVKQFSPEEIFTYNGGENFVYYFPPSSKITSRQQLLEKATKVGTKKLIKKGVKKGALVAISEGMKSLVTAKLLSKPAAKAIGKNAGGPVLDVAIGSAEAGYTTYQSRSKEKVYEETGGAKGFSRTKANKEIASSWSSAGAGAAGGMGTAALLTAGAAAAGQIAIPIPVVGAAIGAAVLSPLVFVGSAIGGYASGKIGGKVSSMIYDTNMATKCPLCQRYSQKSQETNQEDH